MFLPILLILLTACSRGIADDSGLRQREVVHEGARWDVFEIDLARVQLRLFGQADPKLRRFSAVRARLDADGVRWGMLTNGGMFHEGERPVGLHVEAGKAYAPLELSDGEGNFFLKPNGVFYLDAQGAHVVASEGYAPQARVRLATQSGPLLVRAGALHPRFLPGSPNEVKRSGVGVRDRDHIAIAVSRGPVSFHDAATLFRDALRCPDALYLDGGISDFDTPARRDAATRAFGSVLAAVLPAPPE